MFLYLGIRSEQRFPGLSRSKEAFRKANYQSKKLLRNSDHSVLAPCLTLVLNYAMGQRSLALSRKTNGMSAMKMHRDPKGTYNFEAVAFHSTVAQDVRLSSFPTETKALDAVTLL
jgi:hypothetical protein